MFFKRGQRIADGARASGFVGSRKSTSEALTQGGTTSMPPSWPRSANTPSLSVLPMSSVIDAAKNSTG